MAPFPTGGRNPAASEWCREAATLPEAEWFELLRRVLVAGCLMLALEMLDRRLQQHKI
jgi:hypothetical protein